MDTLSLGRPSRVETSPNPQITHGDWTLGRLPKDLHGDRDWHTGATRLVTAVISRQKLVIRESLPPPGWGDEEGHHGGRSQRQ